MAELFRPTKPHALPPDAEIVVEDGKPHARIRDGKQVKLFPLTADGKRYLKPIAVWCAEVVGADGKRRQVRFSPNKDAARMMLEKAGVQPKDRRSWPGTVASRSRWTATPTSP